MNEHFNEQKALLQQHFPNIDISSLDCHGEIEKEICKHLKELTEEQWNIILDRKVNDLFQDGIPHISWNTDRSHIFQEIEKLYEPVASKTYDETWYHIVIRYYEVLPGFYLQLKHEKSHSISGSSHRYITVASEVPTYTHSAAIILLDNDGRFCILDQMTGTESACKEFIARKCADYQGSKQVTFELMKR